MEVKDDGIEDEIEIKFLKTILQYHDIKQRTVQLDGEVVVETHASKYIFGHSIRFFQQRTENLVLTNRQQSRAFFNPWFSKSLHAVSFNHPYWHYFTFYLQTEDNGFIPFRPPKRNVWFDLGTNTTFFPEFKIFMEENIRNMKAKQTILQQHLDAVRDDIPIELYNIIAQSGLSSRCLL